MSDYKTNLNLEQGKSTVMNRCRELMTCHLKESLPTMMDEVDDVLLEIAVKTNDSQERTKYFNAMHEVRLNRHNIERKCLENLLQSFSKKTLLESNEKAELDTNSDMSSVAMTNVVNKVRNDCHQTLLGLDQRMRKILNTQDLGAKVNPVSPEVVCKSFYSACELVDTETEIKLIIYKYFEKCVVSPLNDVYLEIGNAIEADVTESDTSNNWSEHSLSQTISENETDKFEKNEIDEKSKIKSELALLLNSEHAPDFVSDFVLNHWQKLLDKIYDKQGTDSNAWLHAMETVEDLVWSVGTISGKKDRSKFDKLWPDLIMRLRNGINMISMPSHEQTAFISKLFKHRAALTMLGKLSKTKSEDVTLIRPDKISALKSKFKSTEVHPTVEKMDVESIGDEDVTIPVLEVQSQAHMHQQRQKHIRPFMDELLVDNHNDVKGFKTDITGG